MDRRDFMKASAGAFFIASTGRAFGAMAPSSRLRFALLGCREGGRGISVMDSALKVPGVEIAVVCDPDSRAMDFASAWLVGKGLPAPKKEKDFRTSTGSNCDTCCGDPYGPHYESILVFVCCCILGKCIRDGISVPSALCENGDDVSEDRFGSLERRLALLVFEELELEIAVVPDEGELFGDLRELDDPGL